MAAYPWLDARTYYQRRWGADVGRIGVDGGFSCPNRGHNRQSPGCAFCSGAANRPPYQAGATDVGQQVRQAKAFLTHRYAIEKFSLYFQAYSSTWAPVESLRVVYDEGLAQADFVELVVGTRPDCVPEAVADLLASYQSTDREVWVELGLQSSRDATLQAIGRGHSSDDFIQAASRLRERGIRFTTHVMYGLPGETEADFLESVKFALRAGTSGIKLHDLLLVEGTALYTQWQQGNLAPVDPQSYLLAVAKVLAALPSHVVVWRVMSDPENRKATPPPGEKWSKNLFLNRLREEVLRRRADFPS